ncbi:MAG: hypothetical protein ACOCVF_00395 [bacterium]
MADRLEELSKVFRENQLAKNIITNQDQYDEAHSHAVSDGDEHGKGELNNSVGGVTDIKTRESAMKKKKFTPNKEYNESTFDKI